MDGFVLDAPHRPSVCGCCQPPPVAGEIGKSC
jgi:hypothetical protein